MAEPRETTRKNDVARTPETQHEKPRSQPVPRQGELATRGGGALSRDPFAIMNTLRHQMDRLFDDFAFGGSLFQMPRMFGDLEKSLWTPQVELYEREGKLHVCTDLPGLTKDDVHIEVLENNLTIEGERKSEKKDEKGGWSERSYGRFFRSIPLPEGINPDTAKATFDNGVLDIAFEAPKLEERKGKQIPIGA